MYSFIEIATLYASLDSTHHSNNLQRTDDFGQNVYKKTCLRNEMLILKERNSINRWFLFI